MTDARGTLAGQVAVVTGGARGIGLGIAQRLAQEGCVVAVWDRDAGNLDVQAAGWAPRLQVGMDVADALSVEQAFDTTLRELGRVDIMVNNAGINGPVVPVAEYPLDAWQRVLAVNLTGVFHCCRVVIPHMTGNRHGRIINVASIAGKEGVPGIAAYSAAKHGVVGFTKSLARELAETGVLANCVAPVMTETALLQEMTPAHIAASRARIPMGRFLTIPEIAAMVAWIAGPECSFTTGFVFDLSGGRADY